MTIASRIPPREVVGFLTVGFFGLIADVGVFNLGIAWGVRPTIASLFGFLLGATVSFLGNHLFTFADRQVDHAGKAYLVFLGINVIAVSAVQAVVWIGETMVASVLALNVMRLAAIAVVTVGRFVAYRTWVFRPPMEVGPHRGSRAPMNEALARE